MSDQTEAAPLVGAIAFRGKLDEAERYRTRLVQCLMLARLAADIPTGEILDSIERADSVGAIFDPTLYREKHAAMMQDKELVKAVHGLAEFGRSLRERARGEPA